jgi:predicted TIM-barrel fold metal-dependent hydrolase
MMWDNPIDRYIEVMDGVVGKAVILGLKSYDTYGIEVPNEYLAEATRQHPEKLAWCCCVVPTDSGAVEEVEKCVKEMGAVGVGELGPAYGGYHANDRAAYPVYELCQSLGVPIIMHAGPSQPRSLRMRYSDVLEVDDIAIDFPDLKIVISHCGYYKYDDAAFLVAKHPNVFTDISWLPNLSGLERSTMPRYLPVVTYPYINFFYPLLSVLSQPFGNTDKLIFGTDWTSSPPEKYIKLLRGINEHTKALGLPEVPEETIERILNENWKQVFPGLAEEK